VELNESYNKFVIITDAIEHTGKANKRSSNETSGMLTVMKMPMCINVSAINNETNKMVITDLENYIEQLRKSEET
jgi:hypothetical protein